MSSFEDVNADNTTLAPLSLRNLYQSDQVFGLCSPSAHSFLRRISLSGASVSSARPDQDAFDYRNIGPALVLKTYQSKNSSLDWPSSTSTNPEDSTQTGDSDRSSLLESFAYCTDLIYDKLNLTDPDQFHPVDGKQMNLLQFDQGSLDTQVEQSYQTAVTTTSGAALAYADESIQHSDLEATELTNQSQQIHQQDLPTEGMAPLPLSPHPQPQTDSLVSELNPSQLHENPVHRAECSNPSLLACVIPHSGPKVVLASELDASSLLSNPIIAASSSSSSPPLLTDVQNELDHRDTKAENSAKISEAHVDENNIHSVSNSNITSIGPACHVKCEPSHAEGYNTLSDNANEISQHYSTQPAGTCPITSESEVASKSDDQVTIESTVIQSSRPSSATNPSRSPLAPGTGATSLTLDKTDCPSKPTFAVNDSKTLANTPSVNSILEAPVSDLSPVLVENSNPVSTGLSPEAEGQGAQTACPSTDILTCSLDNHTDKPTEPAEPSEPASTAQAVPTAHPLPFPAVNVTEDNTASAAEKQPASVAASPEGFDPVSNENVIPEAGKESGMPESGKENAIPEPVIKDTTFNDRTPQHDIVAPPVSSKQASRMRSISGFIKTLSKKQSMKLDVLNSPGSGSIKSEGEEKSSLTIKALPKRKSLSSLKVKSRFSSFYRSIDEPVPTNSRSQEPPRISEEEREVILDVEGTTTPLKKSPTRSPSTLPDQEQPSQAARAMDQVISASDVKANIFTRPHKMLRAKRGLKSRSQTIIPRSTSSIDNLEKPFPSVGELGSTPFARPKTLRKRRTFQPQASTPVLKDISLSGLISKLMRKNPQKDGVA